jgi:hypothetical protein
MRRRYDSREMVGMLRAWKVSAEVGDVREEWEAAVRDWRRTDWEGVGWCDGGRWSSFW